MSETHYKAYRATILNPRGDESCDLFKDGLMLTQGSEEEGYKIAWLGSWKGFLAEFQNKIDPEIVHWPHDLILPSFIDLHFHWVQDDVRTMPKEELLQWLRKYTWPHEAGFADHEFAEHKAKKFSRYLLSVGTLGGMVYGSPHPHSVELAHKHFMGDFICGNPLMTMNCLESLKVSPDEALMQVRKLSESYGAKYAFTPRIAPVTHPHVMVEGGEASQRFNSFMQTHLSETRDEIDWVLDIFRGFEGFESVSNYTEIYDRCGLVSDKSVLGHCIHLNESEFKVLAEKGAAIAHCPSSNAPVEKGGLGSGLLDLKMVERYNIPWALGSDIGGGPWLSMFDVMQSFVEQHKEVENSYTKALYRATLAPADIMNLGSETGDFSIGKWVNFCTTALPTTSVSQAEQVLRDLIEPFSEQRKNYDHLVKKTFYKGNEVFAR